MLTVSVDCEPSLFSSKIRKREYLSSDVAQVARARVAKARIRAKRERSYSRLLNSRPRNSRDFAAQILSLAVFRAKERLLAGRWLLSQSTIFGENTVYCLEGSRQFVKKVTLVR